MSLEVTYEESKLRLTALDRVNRPCLEVTYEESKQIIESLVLKEGTGLEVTYEESKLGLVYGRKQDSVLVWKLPMRNPSKASRSSPWCSAMVWKLPMRNPSLVMCPPHLVEKWAFGSYL